MELKKITSYLDNYLNIGAFRDDSANGLQVTNSENIEKIGLAVDACLEAIQKAGNAQCNLLIVHHGLFWGKQELIVGNHFQRMRSLIMADMALYDVGHNIQISKKIGLSGIEPFAEYYGTPIGMKGKIKKPKSCSEVVEDLEKAVGPCKGLLKFGPEQIYSIGVVSGSATDSALFKELKIQAVDLFVTGEPKHGAYYLAQEYGLNVLYCGHYLTETFGIKALGEHLKKQLNIATEFIDVPCIF
jgi:dinuclear metal center YbgI/SA1388 family protein